MSYPVGVKSLQDVVSSSRCFVIVFTFMQLA
jgi:hypothetical protein